MISHCKKQDDSEEMAREEAEMHSLQSEDSGEVSRSMTGTKNHFQHTYVYKTLQIELIEVNTSKVLKILPLLQSNLQTLATRLKNSHCQFSHKREGGKLSKCTKRCWKLILRGITSLKGDFLMSLGLGRVLHISCLMLTMALGLSGRSFPSRIFWRDGGTYCSQQSMPRGFLAALPWPSSPSCIWSTQSKMSQQYGF